MFCSLLEDGYFQRAFSVLLESKNVRSGFGRSAPRLSRSLSTSAGLFNNSVGIGVGLVDFCDRRPSGLQVAITKKLINRKPLDSESPASSAVVRGEEDGIRVATRYKNS